jgi:hypothetical protein
VESGGSNRSSRSTAPLNYYRGPFLTFHRCALFQSFKPFEELETNKFNVSAFSDLSAGESDCCREFGVVESVKSEHGSKALRCTVEHKLDGTFQFALLRNCERFS